MEEKLDRNMNSSSSKYSLKTLDSLKDVESKLSLSHGRYSWTCGAWHHLRQTSKHEFVFLDISLYVKYSQITLSNVQFTDVIGARRLKRGSYWVILLYHSAQMIFMIEGKHTCKGVHYLALQSNCTKRLIKRNSYPPNHFNKSARHLASYACDFARTIDCRANLPMSWTPLFFWIACSIKIISRWYFLLFMTRVGCSRICCSMPTISSLRIPQLSRCSSSEPFVIFDLFERSNAFIRSASFLAFLADDFLSDSLNVIALLLLS